MSVTEITLLNQGKVKDWRRIVADTVKALNNDVVHNTENEIINGVKTFTQVISGTSARAVADGNGDNIASTYLKAADVPSIIVTSQEPTTQSTSTLQANSIILWTDDEE